MLPAQARPPLPSRGRTAGGAGAPVPPPPAVLPAFWAAAPAGPLAAAVAVEGVMTPAEDL